MPIAPSLVVVTSLVVTIGIPPLVLSLAPTTVIPAFDITCRSPRLGLLNYGKLCTAVTQFGARVDSMGMDSMGFDSMEMESKGMDSIMHGV